MTLFLLVLFIVFIAALVGPRHEIGRPVQVLVFGFTAFVIFALSLHYQ